MSQVLQDFFIHERVDIFNAVAQNKKHNKNFGEFRLFYPTCTFHITSCDNISALGGAAWMRVTRTHQKCW
jgi:hypothetical protein